MSSVNTPLAKDLFAIAPAAHSVGGLQWEIRSAAMAETLAAILGDPDSYLEGHGHTVAESSMVKIARVPLSLLSGSCLLRRYRYLKPGIRYRDVFRVALAVHGFRMALAMEQAGVPTPRVLAAGARRKLRVPSEGYLLVEEVPQAVKLARFVGGPSGLSRNSLAAVARAMAAMHTHGLVHGDLTINNVLLDGAGMPWFIDLERARKINAALGWRRTVDDLHRLARHFLKFSPAGRRGALRGLRIYCVCRGWAGRERELIQALTKRLRGKPAHTPAG